MLKQSIKQLFIFHHFHLFVLYLFSILLLPTYLAHAGTLTTVAGTGTANYSGDGGLATSAALKYPMGIAIDSSGNLYVADKSNCRIRKITTTGVISTVAGNGTCNPPSGDGGLAINAQISYPFGVAVDGSGNLYFADWFNSPNVRKVDTSGIITTLTSPGDIGDADAIAVDSAGTNIYIADTSNNRVRKLSFSGTWTISTIAGTGVAGFSGDGGAAISAQLNEPRGVVVDGAGNLYISDFYNSRIRKVDTSGIISTFAGNGLAGWNGDGGAATSAKIDNTRGLFIDGSGNLYFAAYSTNQIRKVTRRGLLAL